MSSQHNLRVCSVALAALFATACSSDGRLAFNGGSVGGASAPSSGNSGGNSGGNSNGNNGSGGTGTNGGSNGGQTGSDGGGSDVAEGGTVQRIVANGDDALASAGNVGDLLLQSGRGAGDDTQGAIDNTVETVRDAVNSGGAAQTADAALNPLGRVSVGDETLVGSDASGSQQAIGVSVLSEGQNTGHAAAIGVLADGQILHTDVTPDGGGREPLGVALNGQQVVGASNDTIALSVAGPTAQGDVASVNVLNNGDIANVDVTGAITNAAEGAAGAVEDSVGALGGVLPD